jgi:hypothetical protein
MFDRCRGAANRLRERRYIRAFKEQSDMAEADLDLIIRQIAKAQSKSVLAAVKKRRDQIMARAAKARDKEAREQLRLMAKSTVLLGTAAAKRLQNSAENTADSYARAIRHAAEEAAREAAKNAAKEAAKAASKPAKKAKGAKPSAKKQAKAPT